MEPSEGTVIHTLYEIEQRDAEGRWLPLETTMDKQTAAVRCEALALADDQPHIYRVVYEVYRCRSPSWGVESQYPPLPPPTSRPTRSRSPAPSGAPAVVVATVEEMTIAHDPLS